MMVLAGFLVLHDLNRSFLVRKKLRRNVHKLWFLFDDLASQYFILSCIFDPGHLVFCSQVEHIFSRLCLFEQKGFDPLFHLSIPDRFAWRVHQAVPLKPILQLNRPCNFLSREVDLDCRSRYWFFGCRQTKLDKERQLTTMLFQIRNVVQVFLGPATHQFLYCCLGPILHTHLYNCPNN